MVELFKKYKNAYFIGIGGIGMSAIARYFGTMGIHVAGYDKTPSELTEALVSEGIAVQYNDDPEEVPAVFKGKNSIVDTLVVYTPAIPIKNKVMGYFQTAGYDIEKRAKVLGMIANSGTGIAVAGSHGKTTVSTIAAHIFNEKPPGCNAFLGGISKKYNSNILLSKNSDTFIVEADEYDRSFHHIYPKYAIITAIDEDHLDVYGTKDEIEKSFNIFVNNITEGGTLLYNRSINKDIMLRPAINTYTYALDDHRADYYADNIVINDGSYYFDIHTPSETIHHVMLGVPGLLNVENAVAAAGIADCAGIDKNTIKYGLEKAQGVKRRLDFQIRNNNLVYIDDYAHHPEEINYCIRSVREMFPGKKILGIFQPHLYSRTRDLADAFAESLSKLDELIMLDIYPAREKPIDNVNSSLILNKVKIKDKTLCEKKDVTSVLHNKKIDVLLTMGAGDIDRLVPEIKKFIINNKLDQ